jgi:hypothetical protein
MRACYLRAYGLSSVGRRRRNVRKHDQRRERLPARYVLTDRPQEPAIAAAECRVQSEREAGGILGLWDRGFLCSGAMKLLLLGATGGSGRQLLSQALDRGHELTALVRSPGS